jgi:glycosyltransferase involved in cell wall biosynthesis
MNVFEFNSTDGFPDSPDLPTISIVTPNYNYAHFLEATLKSVLDQRYPKLEYIVHDGGSTDGSVDVIRRYADRLAYWHSRRDAGQYQTIAAGLNRATGEVMGWLNSDDLQTPWTLHVVGRVFAAFPAVDWISSLVPLSWDCIGLPAAIRITAGFSGDAYLDGAYAPGARIPGQWVTRRQASFIQQESTFWRRSLWEKAGGYLSNEFGPAGDFELWGRFFERAELVGVSAPLAGFRHQHRQQTSDIARYAESCGLALAAARRRAGWRGPSTARRLVQLARIDSVPLVRRWAVKAVGYRVTRIRRNNPSGPTPSWLLDSCCIL